MDVYSGEAKFIGDYFQAQDLDFVIPEYQREFSWQSENVSQLFLDLMHGAKRISINDSETTKREDKSKFLGCIIQWLRDAKEGKDFYPSKTTYISNIREIIDGQQRTSTLLLVFIRYYFYFEQQRKYLNDTPEEKLLSSFIKKTVQKSWLFGNFAINIPPTRDKKYRPALIRQESDLWDRDNTHAKYSSPISQYIYDAITSIQGVRATNNLADISSTDNSANEVIVAIDHQIDQIYSSFDYCALDGAFSIDDLISEDLEDEYCEADVNIKAYLDSNANRLKVITPIVNNLSVINYLLNYCAFTVISSPTQNSALDMFQSLNSSGVQLTALQMLKPNLSSDFKDKNSIFKNSPTSTSINAINTWFNEDGRSRERKLKQFFLKFCVMFNGEEAPASLSLQRSWVQTTYSDFTSKQSSLECTTEYVELMESTKEYLSTFVLKSAKLMDEEMGGLYQNYKLSHPLLGDKQLSDQCILSLMYLRDAKHELMHALLCRFFHQFRMTKNSKEMDESFNDFNQIAIACASIFTLFRVGFNKHPDTFYRKLYQQHFSITKMPALTAKYVLDTLKSEFDALGKEKFVTSDYPSMFVNSFKSNCRYNKFSNSILRFILLHNTHKKVDNHVSGLQQTDTTGPDVLTPKYWRDPELESIEHICPNAARTDTNIDFWPQDLINSKKIDDIGNLTLLRLGSNASIGEKTRQKLFGYENYTTPGNKNNTTPVIANNSKNAATQYQLLPIIKRLKSWISDIDSNVIPEQSEYQWDAAFIDSRSENIAELVCYDLFEKIK